MKFKNGYYVAALWIFLLVGVKCKDKENDSSRYFYIGYQVIAFGVRINNVYFSEGELRSKEYFENVVYDAYRCEGQRLDSGSVLITSLYEFKNKEDYIKFKGGVELPEFCKPDSTQITISKR